jgi:hypothetical protein
MDLWTYVPALTTRNFEAANQVGQLLQNDTRYVAHTCFTLMSAHKARRVVIASHCEPRTHASMHTLVEDPGVSMSEVHTRVSID